MTAIDVSTNGNGHARRAVIDAWEASGPRGRAGPSTRTSGPASSRTDVEDAERTAGLTYRFEVSCATCGGHLVHVASGTPGMDTRAVARCGTCQLHWGVVVTLSDVTALMGRPEDVVDSGDRRHGEYATYAKGKCRCPACRAAAASYRRKLRSRKRLEGVA